MGVNDEASDDDDVQNRRPQDEPRPLVAVGLKMDFTLGLHRCTLQRDEVETVEAHTRNASEMSRVRMNVSDISRDRLKDGNKRGLNDRVRDDDDKGYDEGTEQTADCRK